MSGHDLVIETVDAKYIMASGNVRMAKIGFYNFV